MPDYQTRRHRRSCFAPLPMIAPPPPATATAAAASPPPPPPRVHIAGARVATFSQANALYPEVRS